MIGNQTILLGWNIYASDLANSARLATLDQSSNMASSSSRLSTRQLISQRSMSMASLSDPPDEHRNQAVVAELSVNRP